MSIHSNFGSIPQRQHTLLHTLQRLSNPQQLPGVAKLTAKVKDGSLDWANRAIVQLTGKGLSEHMVKSLAFGLQQPGALETYRKLATLKAKVREGRFLQAPRLTESERALLGASSEGKIFQNLSAEERALVKAHRLSHPKA